MLVEPATRRVLREELQRLDCSLESRPDSTASRSVSCTRAPSVQEGRVALAPWSCRGYEGGSEGSADEVQRAPALLPLIATPPVRLGPGTPCLTFERAMRGEDVSREPPPAGQPQVEPPPDPKAPLEIGDRPLPDCRAPTAEERGRLQDDRREPFPEEEQWSVASLRGSTYSHSPDPGDDSDRAFVVRSERGAIAEVCVLRYQEPWDYGSLDVRKAGEGLDSDRNGKPELFLRLSAENSTRPTREGGANTSDVSLVALFEPATRRVVRVEWERFAFSESGERTSSTTIERTFTVKKQKLVASPWTCHEERTRRGRTTTHTCGARVFRELGELLDVGGPSLDDVDADAAASVLAHD